MDIRETENYREELMQLIMDAKRADSVALIKKKALEFGYPFAINDILEPVLNEIGELWSREEISLAQGYLSAKITEDILLNAAQSADWQTQTLNKKIPVVLANIEDDFHSLGRKMVGVFLTAAGWEVHDMGNDVPAEDIINKALEVNAPIIGISAMMYSAAQNIKKVRDELNRLNLQDKIKMAVGGAIFKIRPSMLEEVGGDGTTASATRAPQLFSELLLSIKQQT
jgi:methylmalonyl-CoA mutase cobalamin-binding domain/chain